LMEDGVYLGHMENVVGHVVEAVKKDVAFATTRHLQMEENNVRDHLKKPLNVTIINVLLTESGVILAYMENAAGNVVVV